MTRRPDGACRKLLAPLRKASENPASFRVVDGTIACDGPRAHLFYVGLDGKASFENFEAQVEVRARAGANSGFYFHTAYQEQGWPAQGFEVQVDYSQKEHDGYRENKMTGRLYGIRNVYKAMAKDDEWFTLGVTVQKPRVEIRVNGTLVVSWIEPPGPLPAGAPTEARRRRALRRRARRAGLRASAHASEPLNLPGTRQ